MHRTSKLFHGCNVGCQSSSGPRLRMRLTTQLMQAFQLLCFSRTLGTMVYSLVSAMARTGRGDSVAPASWVLQCGAADSAAAQHSGAFYTKFSQIYDVPEEKVKIMGRPWVFSSQFSRSWLTTRAGPVGASKIVDSRAGKFLLCVF